MATRVSSIIFDENVYLQAKYYCSLNNITLASLVNEAVKIHLTTLSIPLEPLE